MFELSDLLASDPNTATATTNLEFTFTAIPRTVLSSAFGRCRHRRRRPPTIPLRRRAFRAAMKADSAGNDISVELGIGDGTFSVPHEVLIDPSLAVQGYRTMNPWSISSSGDFNGDGIIDLAVSTRRRSRSALCWRGCLCALRGSFGGKN